MKNYKGIFFPNQKFQLTMPATIFNDIGNLRIQNYTHRQTYEAVLIKYLSCIHSAEVTPSGQAETLGLHKASAMSRTPGHRWQGKNQLYSWLVQFYSPGTIFTLLTILCTLNSLHAASTKWKKAHSFVALWGRIECEALLSPATVHCCY